MPLPALPELPDDDPVQALRMVWHYMGDLASYLSPLRVLALGISIPLVLLVLVLIFGARLNPLVSWAADCVPLFFTFVGIVLTLRDVKDEHKTLVIIMLAVVGICGTAVLHLDRTNQQSEMQRRLDAVGTINSQVLQAWLDKGTQGNQTELARRQNIVNALRGKYILNHKDVSPGLLAGTEFPPADWMNNQLEEIGETWRISPSKPVQPPAPTVGANNASTGNLKERTLSLSQNILDDLYSHGWKSDPWDTSKKPSPNLIITLMPHDSEGGIRWIEQRSYYFRDEFLPRVRDIRDEYGRIYLHDENLDKFLRNQQESKDRKQKMGWPLPNIHPYDIDHVVDSLRALAAKI